MRWPGYAWAAGVTAVATLAGLAISPRFELVTIAMLYLLAVVLIALRFGRGPVVAASILGVAGFNFCFVPPRGTFAVDDPQYLLTFAMMLVVGLIVSGLAESVRARTRAQAELALEAESERIRNALCCLDLARPAHAARGDLRRVVEPRRTRRAARAAGATGACA